MRILVDQAGNNGATVGDGISGGAYWTSWVFNPLGERTTQTQHSLTGGTDTVTTYTYGNSSQPDTLTGRSRLTRIGGIGTILTVPVGRCLSPRGSCGLPLPVQAVPVRGQAPVRVIAPRPCAGRVRWLW